MLTISNYHYIREHFNTKFPSIFGVTPDNFRKQLLLLKNQADFISGKDLITDGSELLKSKNNYYFVTFDDGLKEQYKYALPILEELNIPAVFFANSRNHEDKKVSTVHKIHLLRSILSAKDLLKFLNNQCKITDLTTSDFNKAKNTYIYDDLESASLKYLINFKMNFSLQEQVIKTIFDNYFDEYKVLQELYMNESEVIELGKKGFLGSHTHNHYPIGLLHKNEIEFELKDSKSYFEKLTNSAIDLVAYPYGTPDSCTLEVAEIAAKTGYKFGFTTTRGKNSEINNIMLLNRFDCNDLIGGKNYKQNDK